MTNKELMIDGFAKKYDLTEEEAENLVWDVVNTVYFIDLIDEMYSQEAIDRQFKEGN